MEEYKALKRDILLHRHENWVRILRDLDMTAELDHTVVHFPNPSTYVFSTRQDFFWMLDPYYARDGESPEADAETLELAQMMAKRFSVYLVSHLHSDHCQPSLVKVLAQTTALWIVPQNIREGFLEISGAAPDKVLSPAWGESITVSGITVTLFDGYHGENGKPPVPGCSFLIALPDSTRLFFPGDIRSYDRPVPDAALNSDYLFAHIFFGREPCTGDTFSSFEPFCDFITSMHSKNTFLTHIGDTGRAWDAMWTKRHGLMARQRLLELNPRQTIHIPAYGSHDHLVKERSAWRDVFPDWNAERQQDFLNHLGVSLKQEPLEWMERCISEQIPVVEWMAGALSQFPRERICEMIHRWRAVGGKCLSVHFPHVEETMRESLEQAVKQSLAVSADRITVHVPYHSLKEMRDPASHDVILRLYEDTLRPLTENGIRVGIENLHTKPDYPLDDNRQFGFLPDECRALIMELRERLHTDLVGFHFDIGHAYSNSPYSNEFTTERWLEELGDLLNGMHIHQFEQAISPRHPWLGGHRHVSGRTAGHPSLRPVYDAWAEHRIHAPMILEVCRGDEPEPFHSLERLRQMTSETL